MSRSRDGLLVISGEASGDRIAAEAVQALRAAGFGGSVFGMGGPLFSRSGAEVVADFRRTTAMGTSEVVSRLPALARNLGVLALAIRRRPPRAALLVDYTEVNLRLGACLRQRGVPVLFAVAPQLWAWRPGRLPAVRRSLDRLAVILPFEEALFRAGGIDAHYIGHPALEALLPSRAAARERLGLSSAPAIALLPGSRPHEVRATLPTMLEGLTRLRTAAGPLDARLLVAPSLDPATSSFAKEQAARALVEVVSVDPGEGISPLLPAFDAAVVTSGTATLECALAGAPPLVVYRASQATAFLARRLLRLPHVALPNILLGERRYPELLQEDFTAPRVAAELSSLLERRHTAEADRDELLLRLRPNGSARFGERLAKLMTPWLPRHEF